MHWRAGRGRGRRKLYGFRGDGIVEANVAEPAKGDGTNIAGLRRQCKQKRGNLDASRCNAATAVSLLALKNPSATFFKSNSHNNVKQAVRQAATICPRPMQVDL